MKTISYDFLVSSYNIDVADYIFEKAEKYNFDLCFQRKSKRCLGCFKRPGNGTKNLVFVDHSLPKDLQLIVLCHEMAHAENWATHSGAYKAHGGEWKILFSRSLNEIRNIYEFDSEWKTKLIKIIANPRATIDLQKSANPETGLIQIRNIEDWKKFEYNGVVYLKYSLRKTRYLCIRKSDGKRFLFHADAMVKKIDENE